MDLRNSKSIMGGRRLCDKGRGSVRAAPGAQWSSGGFWKAPWRSTPLVAQPGLRYSGGWPDLVLFLQGGRHLLIGKARVRTGVYGLRERKCCGFPRVDGHGSGGQKNRTWRSTTRTPLLATMRREPSTWDYQSKWTVNTTSSTPTYAQCGEPSKKSLWQVPQRVQENMH